MKKKYIKPEFEVVELKVQNQLLQSSVVGFSRSKPEDPIDDADYSENY